MGGSSDIPNNEKLYDEVTKIEKEFRTDKDTGAGWIFEGSKVTNVLLYRILNELKKLNKKGGK
jgi:hypothetical protein